MFGFSPNPEKRKVRLLREAQNQLIDAELALDAAKAYAAAAKTRVERLTQQLAPAKTIVTPGDITQPINNMLRISARTRKNA